jgi:hypothetical protein
MAIGTLLVEQGLISREQLESDAMPSRGRQGSGSTAC